MSEDKTIKRIEPDEENGTLVHSMKIGDVVIIDEKIIIHLLRIEQNRAVLRFKAPKSIKIKKGYRT